MPKFIIAVTLILTTANCSVSRAIRSGTADVSHTICVETFLSQIPAEQSYAQVLKKQPGFWLIGWGTGYKIENEKKYVSAAFLGGFTSRATYLPGYGCLLHDGEQPVASAIHATAKPTEAKKPIVASSRFDAALDRAFAQPAGTSPRNTRAVVVMHRGKIVAERYAAGLSADTPLLSRSLTKSLIATLVGRMVAQRKLSTAQKANFSEWQSPGDKRREITVDHLLRMTSGLEWGAETHSGFDAASRMESSERDMAAFVAGLPTEHDAGTHWNYSGGDYVLLGRILRDAAGGSAEKIYRYMQDELFEPAGMKNTIIELDGTGTPVGSYAAIATARDWAQLGELYLNDGMVGNRRLLPKGWRDYIATTTLGTGYGAGFWTNRVDGKVPYWGFNWKIQDAPDETIRGFGYLGQFLLIVPSKNLVVVRLGVTHRVNPDEIAGVLLSDVIAALETP